MDQEALINRLGALALALADRIGAAAATVAGHGGLSAAALVTIGAPVTRMADLQAALGLSQPGTVRLLDRLAADGLIERGRDAADGRAVVVRLTAWGEARRRELLARRRAVLDGLVADLDETERAVLERLVDRLLPALAEDRAASFRICRLCDEQACGGDSCPLEARFPAAGP